MNYGFDLDKIFINYPPFIPDIVIDRLYKKKSNGTLLYNIPSKPEQILRNISHHPLFRRPISNNINVIKKYKNNKDKFFLISSRFFFLKSRTENIIKKYNFESIFEEMHFNYKNQQPHIFKSEAIKKCRIQKYVDDDFPLLKYLAKENKDCKFFWLNTKSNLKLTKNITAITKLDKIFE